MVTLKHNGVALELIQQLWVSQDHTMMPAVPLASHNCHKSQVAQLSVFTSLNRSSSTQPAVPPRPAADH